MKKQNQAEKAAKVKPFPFVINVAELRKQLAGGKQKMPKDFVFGPALYTVPVHTWSHRNGVEFAPPLLLVVTATQPSKTMPRIGHPVNLSRKSSVHRIYVQCDCGRLIPAGRVSQHTH